MCCPIVDPIRIDASIVLMTTPMVALPSPAVARVPPRVSFETFETASISAASSDMSQDERNELWYQQSDLDQFKNDARDICRQIRESCGIAILLDLDLVLSVTPDDCTRGLEHRVSTERHKNKYLATRAILKAQQRYSKPEHLAHVARKCTAWAAEVAFATGCQDFYQVYSPELMHLVPQAPSVQFPLLTKKRTSEPSIEDESSDLEQPFKRLRTHSPIPMTSRKGGAGACA